VGVLLCPGSAISLGGFTITGYVYFDGPAFPDFAVFQAYTWTGTDTSTAVQNIIKTNAGSNTIPTKTWLPFTRVFELGYPADRLTLEVAPNGAWSGTMYLDDINIVGL
jgi:hypothetical protein